MPFPLPVNLPGLTFAPYLTHTFLLHAAGPVSAVFYSLKKNFEKSFAVFKVGVYLH